MNLQMMRADDDGMLPLRERRQDSDMRRAYDELDALAGDLGLVKLASSDEEFSFTPREVYSSIISKFRIAYPDARLDGLQFAEYGTQKLRRILDDYRHEQKVRSQMEGRE